jgi:hypothetical protein
MLVGLSVHDKPAGETDEVRITVPVKPFTELTVIVEEPLTPALTASPVGPAVMVKSGWATLKVTRAVWDREPLTPVMVTVKEPATEAAQESVELLGAVTWVGDRAHARPLEGVTEEARVTFPVNPLAPATVIDATPVPPTLREMLVGLAVTLKSTMLTEIETWWESEPLAPLTVTM